MRTWLSIIAILVLWCATVPNESLASHLEHLGDNPKGRGPVIAVDKTFDHNNCLTDADSDSLAKKENDTAALPGLDNLQNRKDTPLLSSTPFYTDQDYIDRCVENGVYLEDFKIIIHVAYNVNFSNQISASVATAIAAVVALTAGPTAAAIGWGATYATMYGILDQTNHYAILDIKSYEMQHVLSQEKSGGGREDATFTYKKSDTDHLDHNKSYTVERGAIEDGMLPILYEARLEGGYVCVYAKPYDLYTFVVPRSDVCTPHETNSTCQKEEDALESSDRHHCIRVPPPRAIINRVDWGPLISPTCTHFCDDIPTSNPESAQQIDSSLAQTILENQQLRNALIEAKQEINDSGQQQLTIDSSAMLSALIEKINEGNEELKNSIEFAIELTAYQAEWDHLREIDQMHPTSYDIPEELKGDDTPYWDIIRAKEITPSPTPINTPEVEETLNNEIMNNLSSTGGLDSIEEIDAQLNDLLLKIEDTITQSLKLEEALLEIQGSPYVSEETAEGISSNINEVNELFSQNKSTLQQIRSSIDSLSNITLANDININIDDIYQPYEEHELINVEADAYAIYEGGPDCTPDAPPMWHDTKTSKTTCTLSYYYNQNSTTISCSSRSHNGGSTSSSGDHLVCDNTSKEVTDIPIDNYITTTINGRPVDYSFTPNFGTFNVTNDNVSIHVNTSNPNIENAWDALQNAALIQDIETIKDIANNATYVSACASKSQFPITAVVLQCVQDTFYNIMFKHTNNEGQSPLVSISDNLRFIMGSLLILYVMLYGYRIMISQGKIKKGEHFTFLFKFLFVFYFTISGALIVWIPDIIDAAQELTTKVINASISTEGVPFEDIPKDINVFTSPTEMLNQACTDEHCPLPVRCFDLSPKQRELLEHCESDDNTDEEGIDPITGTVETVNCQSFWACRQARTCNMQDVVPDADIDNLNANEYSKVLDAAMCMREQEIQQIRRDHFCFTTYDHYYDPDKNINGDASIYFESDEFRNQTTHEVNQEPKAFISCLEDSTLAPFPLEPTPPQ